MACFTATVVEAAATTIITAVVKKREKKQEQLALTEGAHHYEAPHIKLSQKLSWLNVMLWGGSVLLLFEHIWHGEVVPWFPFFTRAQDPSELQEMLHEIATVGVGMAILVTAVWAVMVLIADLLTKRPEEREKESAV